MITAGSLIYTSAFGSENPQRLPEATIAGALSGINGSMDRLRKICSGYLEGSPLNYDHRNIQMSADERFSTDLRTVCLLPLLTARINENISFFVGRKLINPDRLKPLMIQILENGTRIDLVSENLIELENQLNQLIINFWLSSLFFKELYVVFPATEVESLISNFNKLRSLSYIGGLYQNGKHFNHTYNWGLAEVLGDVLYQVKTDDMISTQISSENGTELACILNPASDYCPQKIIYASNFKSVLQKYLFLQNYLRAPDKFQYVPSSKSKNIPNEFLCAQIRNLTREAGILSDTLNCGTTREAAAKAISEFLDLHLQDGQSVIVAFLFNGDRLHKIFPWGAEQAGKNYSWAAYVKDITFVLDRMGLFAPTVDEAAKVQVLDNVTKEFGEIFRDSK